jgi:hypothetical protein
MVSSYAESNREQSLRAQIGESICELFRIRVEPNLELLIDYLRRHYFSTDVLILKGECITSTCGIASVPGGTDALSPVRVNFSQAGRKCFQGIGGDFKIVRFGALTKLFRTPMTFTSDETLLFAFSCDMNYGNQHLLQKTDW